MTPETARKSVLVSMVILAAISVYRVDKTSSSGSLYKRLWGVGAIGVMLSLAADFVPAIAGPFAILVVLGSLTNGGDTALQNLLAGVGGKIGTSGSATTAAPGPGAGAPAGPTGPTGTAPKTTTVTNKAPAGPVGPISP